MKRLAIWAFYGVGALAIGYLALYAYAVFTGRDLQPGDPIHIFRKPDAPSYSVAFTVIPGRCEAIELWCAIAHLRISRFRVWSLTIPE